MFVGVLYREVGVVFVRVGCIWVVDYKLCVDEFFGKIDGCIG